MQIGSINQNKLTDFQSLCDCHYNFTLLLLLPERDDLGPPVVPGDQENIWDPETFAPRQKSRAEARPTGRAVSRERLGG